MNFKYLYILLLPLALTSCSIQDEENKEALLDVKPSEAQIYEDTFSKMTLSCIKGDFKDVDTIKDLYKKALLDNYKKKDASLLHINTNKNFEKCAIKLRQSGDEKLFDLIVQNSRVAATIARSFYLQDDEVNGAYWAQRVLNMEGLEYGYEVLGDVFIKDRKTLKIGANLLAGAISLGNLNALTLLQNASNQYSAKYFKAQKEAERQKVLQQKRFDKFIQETKEKTDNETYLEDEIKDNSKNLFNTINANTKDTKLKSSKDFDKDYFINDTKNIKNDNNKKDTNDDKSISFELVPLV